MNNFLCKASTGTIVWIIVDILLVVVIVATLCYLYFRSQHNRNQQKDGASSSPATNPDERRDEETTQAQETEQPFGDKATNLPNFLSPNVDAETTSYAISELEQAETPRVQSQPQKVYENKVEHFTNQISNISEEATSELKSKVNFKPRTNPEPPKRVVKDETINLSEKKDTPIKVSSFVDSKSFLETLKAEQTTTSKPKTEKKTSTAKKTTKTTAQKSTATKSAESGENKPKRKYTKRKKDEAK